MSIFQSNGEGLSLLDGPHSFFPEKSSHTPYANGEKYGKI